MYYYYTSHDDDVLQVHYYTNTFFTRTPNYNFNYCDGFVLLYFIVYGLAPVINEIISKRGLSYTSWLRPKKAVIHITHTHGPGTHTLDTPMAYYGLLLSLK
jgi:hypothetical protein